MMDIDEMRTNKEYIYEFCKDNPSDEIWTVIEYTAEDNSTTIGQNYFSFDKKRVYSYWKDYPSNLTKEELEIFKRERPYWANMRKNI